MGRAFFENNEPWVCGSLGIQCLVSFLLAGGGEGTKADSPG